MNDLTAEEIIEQLNLTPLPDEGGFFRRTYLSLSHTKSSDIGALSRCSSSAIYFLLTSAKKGFSRFHRLDGDEIYHFYGGGTAELHLFSAGGEGLIPCKYRRVLLGNNLIQGEVCQYIVPAGMIQGLRPLPGVPWTLLGTTMTPAYNDSGFQLIEREKLMDLYPDRQKIIKAFY